MTAELFVGVLLLLVLKYTLELAGRTAPLGGPKTRRLRRALRRRPASRLVLHLHQRG